MYLAANGIKNRWLNAEERHGGGSRLGLDCTREWRDNDGTRLSLPERIDNGTLPLADMVVIPVPRFGIDRLADGAKHAERAEVMPLHVMLAKAAEETDGSWCGVELRQLVLLNGLPVA